METYHESKRLKERADRDRTRYHEATRSLEKKLQVKEECVTELNRNKTMLNELVKRQEEELKKVKDDNEALQDEMEKENQVHYEQQKLQQQQQQKIQQQQQQQQQQPADVFSVSPTEVRTKLAVHGKHLDTLKKRMSGLRKLHDVMCDDMFSGISAPPPLSGMLSFR